MAKPARKNGRNEDYKAALLTLSLVAGALMVMALSALLSPPVVTFVGQFDRGDELVRFRVMLPPDMQSVLLLRVGLALANIALVSYLLFIYVKQYLQRRAAFTLGIIAFLFSFLLYAVAEFPPVHLVFSRFGFASGFSFIPLLFSAIGLLIFAKLGSD